MKRPIGVTVTAVWMGVLLAAFVTLAAMRGALGPFVAVLLAALSIAPVVTGLWRGRAWAAKSFRALLGLACVLALVAGVATLLGTAPRRPPSYYFARSAIMALWLAYFLRPNVRAFFAERDTVAMAGAGRRDLATLG